MHAAIQGFVNVMVKVYKVYRLRLMVMILHSYCANVFIALG